MMDIIELLKAAKSRGASDLHMVVSSHPLVRINGSLIPLEDFPVITAEGMEQGLYAILTEQEKADFHNNLELQYTKAYPPDIQESFYHILFLL